MAGIDGGKSMTGATRVFCTRLTGLSPRTLIRAIRMEERKFQVLESELDLDFETPLWTKLRIVCTNSSAPIAIEHHIARARGTGVEEETIKFMTLLESVEESWGKREVGVYLRLCREMFILTCEGEADGQTKSMLGKCAAILARHGEGTVQVDDIGFYKKGELILPLAMDHGTPPR